MILLYALRYTAQSDYNIPYSPCLIRRNTRISSPDQLQPNQGRLNCSLALCHRQPSSCCSRSLWVWDVLDLCSFTLLDYFTSMSLLHWLLLQWIICKGEFVSHSLQLCMSVAPNSSIEEITETSEIIRPRILQPKYLSWRWRWRW